MTTNLTNINLITDITDYGLIRVSGIDAEKFLQGQLTCDMREVSAQQSRLGAYCNVKGRVLAIFRIFYYQDAYYLRLPKSIIADTLAQLKKYAVFSKVTLTIDDELAHIGCSGPQTPHILAAIFSQIPKNNDEAINANNCLILKIPGIAPRFEIFTESAEIKNLQTRLEQTNDPTFQKMSPVDTEIWHLLDIQAEIPTIYPETIGMFTPHMLNLPQLNAVSFNKGCYLGQEIIARTEYLGKSKRQMQRTHLNTSTKLLPGSPIKNNENQEIGNIVSVAKTSENYEVLIVMQAQT